MNTQDMSREYLQGSRRYLHEAKNAFQDGDYPAVVRRSQECLELATKALLRFLAVEYPREHDVTGALSAIGARLPKQLQEKLPSWKKLVKELAQNRGPSFYGDERRGIPASRLFGREYAERILPQVEDMHNLISDFVGARP
ncbi:MAG: HEPN domain-containing protein [Chloroflexi bacterium]|nr:HEPN domain-containing protein [Chloroflexota bacterium]